MQNELAVDSGLKSPDFSGNMGRKKSAPGVTRTPDLLIRSQTLSPRSVLQLEGISVRIAEMLPPVFLRKSFVPHLCHIKGKMWANLDKRRQIGLRPDRA